MHWTVKTALTLGVGAGATGVYATAIERNRFTLRRVNAYVLPAGHVPVRILHISDLHLMPNQSRKVAWVRRLADLRPDFLINTGDNVSSNHSLPSLAKALEPLAGTPGVYVNGSNDFYCPSPVNPLKYFSPTTRNPDPVHLPTTALWSLFESFGWHSAEETRLRFSLRGTSIEVRGCGDAHIGRDYYPKAAGPLDPEVDLLIGVTHSPYIRVLDQMTADGCALIVAGHTHGGQVCLPGGKALTTNCDLPLSQAKGLSQWRYGPRTADLCVSAGLGTSPYAPYRLFCPPEATLITLTSK